MPCEGCVGVNNCDKYHSLKQAVREGRSMADFTEDTASCRRGYRCNQRIDYDTPYTNKIE